MSLRLTDAGYRRMLLCVVLFCAVTISSSGNHLNANDNADSSRLYPTLQLVLSARNRPYQIIDRLL
jgi:hypothetical protein